MNFLFTVSPENRYHIRQEQSSAKVGDSTMRPRLIMLGGLLAVLAVSAAHAQIKVDLAKITCRQYLFDKNFSPNERIIVNWLSGYFNGKNNNTVVDIGAMAANKDKVEDYCRQNLDVTLIDATKAALGLGK
jgi:hypothetical protein